MPGRPAPRCGRLYERHETNQTRASRSEVAAGGCHRKAGRQIRRVAQPSDDLRWLREDGEAANQLPASAFGFVFSFGGRRRLPLHVGGRVGAATFERPDVIDHVSRTTLRKAGLSFELAGSRGTALDPPGGFPDASDTLRGACSSRPFRNESISWRRLFDGDVSRWSPCGDAVSGGKRRSADEQDGENGSGEHCQVCAPLSGGVNQFPWQVVTEGNWSS